MLTAKSQEEDILNGLHIGADDYITKPFSLKQLYARMEVILRRTGNDLKPLAQKFSWNSSDLVIDFEHSELQKQGQPLGLTPSEWKILSALVMHPKKVYTREELIVLAVIAVISIASNLLINRQFQQYVIQQQDIQAREIADNLSSQYDMGTGSWNVDYVHGMGMYALDEGYIIKLYDHDGNILWDAQNHDMTLCHQVMDAIAQRMEEERPDLNGEFVTKRFDLSQAGQAIGCLDISYYSPYYMDENAFQFISSLNRILLAMGVVSLAGAILMGVLLANYIANPISRTVKITQQISEGFYSTRFQDNTKTKELSELAQAVNQMAQNLEQQETLRKRLTSDVAHELRTPLANISSWLEMMMEGIWEPTPQRLQSCYDELQRILGLVTDLERLQQAENMKLEKADVDLLELAQTVSKQFETRLMAGHQSCRVSGQHAVVSADRRKVHQVIENLLSNAVKYTGDGGMIQITVESTPDSGIIHVQDNGIGISEQDCKWIFERFYRTDQSRNRKTGGAGIGLSIVKAIVHAHGGRVSVKSEPGKGSCFTVSFPFQAERT